MGSCVSKGLVGEKPVPQKQQHTQQHSSREVTQEGDLEKLGEHRGEPQCHAFYRLPQEARADPSSSRSRRRTPSQLESDRPEGETHGTGGGAGHHSAFREGEDRSPRLGFEVERSGQEEEPPPRILSDRTWVDGVHERDDCAASEGGNGEDLLGQQDRQHGPSRVRNPCQFVIPRSSTAIPGVLPVGNEDSSRGPTQSKIGKIGQVDSAEPLQPRGDEEHGEGDHTQEQSQGRRQEWLSTQDGFNTSQGRDLHGNSQFQLNRSSPADPTDDDRNDESCWNAEGGGGAAEGGSTKEEDRTRGWQQRLLDGDRSDEGRELVRALEAENLESPGLVLPTPEKSKVSESMARFLEKQGESIGPLAFQGLLERKGTWLMEVACSPESRLSAEVQRQAGYESAAVRCSHWNGCDLGTGDGVKQVIFQIENLEPSHVWISPECGPYSPLQAINQRTEEQQLELEEKRRIALKQYVGAACVYEYCIQKGIHVTWEFSERCQAWRLPLLQKLEKKHKPWFAVTHGCQVNMRHPKTSSLIHKGWKIMTTHQRMADMMQLRCRCPKGYQHAKCEGGVAGMTAYYTKEYVKRVCVALFQEMNKGLLAREMEGRTSLLSRFGEGMFCTCDSLKYHGCVLSCGCCVKQEIIEQQALGNVAVGDNNNKGQHQTGNYQKQEEGANQEPPGEQAHTLGDDPRSDDRKEEREETHNLECPECTRKGPEERKNPRDKTWTTCGCVPTHSAYTNRHFTEEQKDEEIKRKLYLLHSSTGHTNIRNMIQALQRRGASARVMKLAKEFQCPVCDEKKRINTKHVASLEVIPPKLSTISADGGKWTHPFTNEDYEFAAIIDEGSRFRVARILKQGRKQTMNAAQFIDYLREGWIQYFGKPQVLRLDPAGAFRSKEIESFCDANDVMLDVIPGEAHWQIGTCEQAVKGLKEVMTKLIEQDAQLEPAAALAEAVRVFNAREIVRGFSPQQHVLGRAPDESGRFIASLTGEQMDELLGNPDGELEQTVNLMKAAEHALIEWQAKQRTNRAMNSRAQRCMDYRPGDLVYFWRKQVSGQPTGKHGRFHGPARVLATETKRDAHGALRPGSSVWCVRGRRLLKCSPEQLRPASRREELIEHLGEDEESRAPWTFPRITEGLGGNEYEDISQEIPDETTWRRSQEPTEAEPMSVDPHQPRHRHFIKRPLSPQREEPSSATGSEAKLNRRSSFDPILYGERESEQAWWSMVDPDSYTTSAGHDRWEEALLSVEVEITMPDSRQGWSKMAEDMESYFVNQLRRRAVEVSEKRMTPDELRQFSEAKEIEVKNFIAARAFEVVPPELRPDASQAIGMRWILTWKQKDEGGYKAKARAILKGFQDPSYEYRSTTTPVMTRQTRQILLQIAAWRKWTTKKGDVSGAFLQGREYPNDLYCIPCKEILQAMNLNDGEIMKVKRGCYGLVDAPLEWYKTISSYFDEIGLVKSWSDPCCWLWKPNGELRGMIAGHVDDFLFTGSSTDSEWTAMEKKIKTRFKWSDWEQGSFIQCGVRIEAQKDGAYHLSQNTYLDKVSEICMNAGRKKKGNEPTNEKEKSQLRALLGALSWHSQQVSPHLSAEVGLLLSEISNSTIETIKRANNLLYQAKLRKEHKLIVHAYPKETKLGMFVWADAAGQNRRDGSSTQGIFLGVAPLTLLEGCVEKVTPIAWHASKIDRVVRSPGAAEAKAVVNGEDLLFHARFQFGECVGGQPNIFDVDSTVNVVDGCVISDSRNVYDKLTTEELSVKGAERRTDLELLCIKSSQRNNNLLLRWVHSEAQLGNALTKGGAKELELYYKMNGCWRIVCDDEMQSAKKRRSKGMTALEQQPRNLGTPLTMVESPPKKN